MMWYRYHNPIVRGFRPDPSICFVKDEYYLVNSTFEFFPGVPILHSRDLIHWEQIGACLTRRSQLELDGCGVSQGIFAPTLRYSDGTFYMITTNVSSKGNFLVYTDDIRGEWSEPQWIDHEGIDPSLFFDDDGKAYYCGTGKDPTGKQGIVLFEINPKTGRILSDKKIISWGMSGKYPEGPHIYKTNGWYYLMMAEGGTEYSHMETIFRSRSLDGPYEMCPSNPILTNRNDMRNPIQCCGHADLAQDANGNWWAVCLGIRHLNDVFLHNLGRETFLAPVQWTEDGWPRVGVDGVIRQTMEGPLPLGSVPTPSSDFEDDFTADTLKPDWMFVRNAEPGRFESGNGRLRIDGGRESLSDFTPAFIGVRQTEIDMTAEVTVSAELLCESAKAGISAYYSMDNHYDFYLQKENGRLYAVLSRKIMDLETVTGKIRVPAGDVPVTLQIQAGDKEYLFSILGTQGKIPVGTGCTAGLCTEGTRTMTFTGTLIGLFASNTAAEFSRFSLNAERKNQEYEAGIGSDERTPSI